MRIAVLVLALACILGCYACAHTNAGSKALTTNVPEPGAAKCSATPNTSAVLADSPQKSATDSAKVSAKVDFATQIKPILEARCQPCHFNGGKVYQRLPFDRPETIKTLGTKLFTRLKDENERRVIREFLAQE
jgi:uncharacterized membrane protein